MVRRNGPQQNLALTNLIGSAYLEFDDVEVPVSNLLGTENKGFKLIMSSKFQRVSMINFLS